MLLFLNIFTNQNLINPFSAQKPRTCITASKFGVYFKHLIEQ